MLQTKKSLAYKDEWIYEKVLAHLTETGGCVLSCDDPEFENSNIIYKRHAFYVDGSVVVVTGVHELEIDNNPHYRSMRFKVFSSDEAEEHRILSELERMVANEGKKK